MGKLTALLTLAQERAKSLAHPYAGSLTPEEAQQVLELAPGSRIVDVRTRAELDWVGRIPGALEIEWLQYPGMAQNVNFGAQLRQQASPESLLMFICRSGARSHQAAETAQKLGYTACYNILEGFEGDKDAKEQRNHIGGWRRAGLPWHQS